MRCQLFCLSLKKKDGFFYFPLKPNKIQCPISEALHLEIKCYR